MKRLWYVVLSVGLFGCPAPKPSPTPSPTPEPGPVLKFPELTLRQSGGALTRNGQPHVVFGAIPCCMEFRGGPGKTGWPAFSKEWVDYTSAKGANFFHLRLGPFTAEAEPEFATIGGAYAAGTLEWNPTFWAHIASLVDYAGSKGANVEVDLIDGWVCKHAQWGDLVMPWPAEDMNACSKTFTAEHRRFVTKAVTELGCYANVTWQLGNENGNIAGFNPQYEFDMIDAIRAAETCTAHMIATNSEKQALMESPKVDYIELHSRSGIDAPQFNKWTANNERNPEFAPDVEHALFCSAQAVGQAWWYWRAGQNVFLMDETLNLFGGGCAGFNPDACPFDVPKVAQIKVKPHGTDFYDATPLVSGVAYCRSIGFTDGRSACSVRIEGDPFREQCEYKTMGGEIQWSLTGRTGDIDIRVQHRSYQFSVVGHGTARVLCGVPNQPGVDLCRSGTGGNVNITR